MLTVTRNEYYWTVRGGSVSITTGTLHENRAPGKLFSIRQDDGNEKFFPLQNEVCACSGRYPSFLLPL